MTAVTVATLQALSGAGYPGVASLDALMEMKRAAGRPKDRIELEILGALRDELEREARSG